MANILIVDDSTFMRYILGNIIHEAGHKIAGEAGDGLKAVQTFQEVHPDLVLMDITMPVMSGMEALKQIKKLDKNSRIIMCSAMGQQALIIEALQLGAKDFIVKPFLKEKVITAITNVLSR